MSEYWKSTPKYYCKHCSTYVRDTKLERTNHDATPKHQGNLRRFLKGLHNAHEREERDKARAKAEVARLNGLTSSSSASSSTTAGPSKLAAGGGGLGQDAYQAAAARVAKSRSLANATPAQRKAQLEQLAEMGVAIPEEFRGSMAMVGEWQVTAQKVVDPEGKNTEAVGVGVHKRVVREDEEEEEESQNTMKRRRWGRDLKGMPADVKEEEEDLDALLGNSFLGKRAGNGLALKKEEHPEAEPGVKTEDGGGEDESEIKKEAVDEPLPSLGTDQSTRGQEEKSTPAGGGIVFKKRKAKNIRQK